MEHWHLRLISSIKSGAWGVAIVGNIIFSPSHSTPGLPQGVPSHQILPGRMPIHGKLFFPPDHADSLASHQLFPGGCPSVGNRLFPPIIPLSTGLPGAPSHQLFPVGSLTVGNISPGYFPFRVPACDPSLIYSLYVCIIYNQYI